MMFLPVDTFYIALWRWNGIALLVMPAVLAGLALAPAMIKRPGSSLRAQPAGE